MEISSATSCPFVLQQLLGACWGRCWKPPHSGSRAGSWELLFSPLSRYRSGCWSSDTGRWARTQARDKQGTQRPSTGGMHIYYLQRPSIYIERRYAHIGNGTVKGRRTVRDHRTVRDVSCAAASECVVCCSTLFSDESLIELKPFMGRTENSADAHRLDSSPRHSGAGVRSHQSSHEVRCAPTE